MLFRSSIKSHIYPCSPTEQAEIDAFIDDQLAKGYICPSTSDQTSGVFFIPKKDGKKRMVQDYRYINSKTLKNNYPLPLIQTLLIRLVMPNYLQKWTFDGAITMSKSGRAMKEKQRLLVTEVLMNHWSYSLVYAIPQPHFRP